MIFLIAIVIGVWGGESSHKRREEKNSFEIDDAETFTKISSGYDPYRNVYWTLKQELKIDEED